jgi:hypothetical protein
MSIRNTFGRYHANDVNSSYDTTNALNEIDNKIDNTVVTQIPALEADIAAFGVRVDTVEGEVATLGTEVATLEGDVATLTSDIGGFMTPADVNTALSDFGNTINLFNPATVIADTFLFNNGSTTAAGGTNISDYMPISALNPIISNHAEIFGGFTGDGPVFYDATKTRISGAANFDGINPITAPAGAVYVRVNVLTSLLNNYMLLRGATLPDHYIPWGMTSSKVVTDRAINSARAMQLFGEVSSVRVGQQIAGATNFVTLYGPGYEPGTYYHSATGNQNTGTIFDTTDYFPVPPGGSITLVGGTHDDFFGIPGHGITYWSVDKQFVSGLDLPHADAVLSVPAQAYWARLTVYPNVANDSNQRTIGIVWGNQPNFDHKFKGVPSLVSMHRPWTNKVWMAAGDSIIADNFNPWFRRAAEYHGCKYIKNQGVAGRFLDAMLKDASFPSGTPFPAGYFADVDMAFLMGPTNTVGSLMTVGTIADAPNISGTTFFAQMKAWVEFVLTDNPYLRLILSTCMQRGGYETSGLPYQQAIRDVAAHYAVELWDPWLTSQFSPLTYSVYSGDGLHPNSGAKDWTLTLGSRFAAYMHTVFPIDFIGDPLYGGPNYNR